MTFSDNGNNKQRLVSYNVTVTVVSCIGAQEEMPAVLIDV